MAVSFSATLRSLDNDRPHAILVTFAAGSILLALWLWWFLGARVRVYEASDEATVEVAGAAHEVGAAVEGRIVEVHLAVGEQVTAGQPLVVLDSTVQSSRLAEESARLAGLRRLLQPLHSSRSSEMEASKNALLVDRQAVLEAEARERQAQSSRREAEAELDRATSLHTSGLISAAELQRAREELEQRSSAADAALQALEQRRARERENAPRRDIALAAVDRQVAELKAAVDTAEAAVARLEFDLAVRTIRAPVSGRLMEVVPLQTGSVVEVGDRVAVVVPDREPTVVARFDAHTAHGRIRVGQQARLRLDAFPWVAHGQLAAEVRRVGVDTTSGTMRVELTLAEAPATTVVPEHGMPGIVLVEVERVSPARLLLRTLGRRVTGAGAQ
jgi:membrane fusion protein (multidrug efflux system)